MKYKLKNDRFWKKAVFAVEYAIWPKVEFSAEDHQIGQTVSQQGIQAVAGRNCG